MMRPSSGNDQATSSQLKQFPRRIVVAPTAHPPKICSFRDHGLDIRPPRRLTSLVALGGDDTAVRRGRRPVNERQLSP